MGLILCIIIVEYIRVLVRQSLPLRGEWSDEGEFNSNLHQFLLVEARKNSDFADWLNKKKDANIPVHKLKMK